jgi:hypothetical protein
MKADIDIFIIMQLIQVQRRPIMAMSLEGILKSAEARPKVDKVIKRMVKCLMHENHNAQNPCSFR